MHRDFDMFSCQNMYTLQTEFCRSYQKNSKFSSQQLMIVSKYTWMNLIYQHSIIHSLLRVKDHRDKFFFVYYL